MAWITAVKGEDPFDDTAVLTVRTRMETWLPRRVDTENATARPTAR